MAKYAYDINKQTKIIDVQKQFLGGLKTVDTDDALGKVYLRKANNVSLSEYSFLEKRHGTYVKQKVVFSQTPIFASNPPFVQGYFEYIDDTGGFHHILFIEGLAYVKLPNSTTYNRISVFSQEEGYNYPDPAIFENVIETNAISFGQEFVDTLNANINFAYETSTNIFRSYTDTVVALISPTITKSTNFVASYVDGLVALINPTITKQEQLPPTNLSASYTDGLVAVISPTITRS